MNIEILKRRRRSQGQFVLIASAEFANGTIGQDINTVPIDTGQSWSKVGSSIIQFATSAAFPGGTKNVALDVGTASHNKYYYIPFETANVKIEVNVQVLTGSGLCFTGFIYRYSSANNYWRCSYQWNGGSGTIVLRKVTNGTSGSIDILIPLVSFPNIVSVTAIESRHELFIDGVSQGSFEDDFNKSETNHGLYCYRGLGEASTNYWRVWEWK